MIFRSGLLLILIAYCQLSTAQALVRDISVEEANRLSLAGEVLLIDIRSESEWYQTGVAPQAITLSMHQSGGLSAFSNRLNQLLAGDKARPLALICASGVHSAKLQRYLLGAGYSQVDNVAAGMLGSWSAKGWISQGYPIKNYKK